MNDPQAIWDTLLASAGSPESSLASARRCKLPLRSQSSPHYLIHKKRELSRLSLALRRKIRALVGGEEPWPLYLWGDAGVGKTCAALCLLDYAGGFYHTTVSLTDEVLAAYRGELHYESGRRIHASNLWEELARASLVVLDDIGCVKEVRDSHYEAVKRLLDEREGKPLVCISNYDLGRVAGLYDKRIASRLAAGTVLELAGEDQRRRR